LITIFLPSSSILAPVCERLLTSSPSLPLTLMIAGLETSTCTPSGKGKRAKSMIGTVTSSIKNMFTGVTEGYTYKLKIVSTHFPINIKVQGDTVIIENFIGERYTRKAKIVGADTKVKVQGEDIIVSGIDKQAVGQTAANIEAATRVRRKDLRKFLDGIYLFEKKVGID
jgi:large subunit ribosomal protein L6